MGYTTSTVHGIEVPDSSEANDVPEDIGKVVAALEAGSIVRRLTGAAIAALTAQEKPAGLVVYNTTTGKLQVSDGTNFTNLDASAVAAQSTADAALPTAGGTMTSGIAMGSNKVTGLAKGTATGDAVARQQIQSGNTGAIANEGYATITFSPAFGSAPVVVFALTGVSNLAGADMWVSDVTVSSARINNSSGYVISANWIAVGN